LEFGIAPDVRRLAEQLPDADFEGAMQVRDPAFAPLDELLIVEMRITDEGVAVEVHSVKPRVF
jgi:hypothetical protein